MSVVSGVINRNLSAPIAEGGKVTVQIFVLVDRSEIAELARNLFLFHGGHRFHQRSIVFLDAGDIGIVQLDSFTHDISYCSFRISVHRHFKTAFRVFSDEVILNCHNFAEKIRSSVIVQNDISVFPEVNRFSDENRSSMVDKNGLL